MLHFINEATEEQLKKILDKITACIYRAIEAGVDVIEVHGDRLVGSLCSTILNKRTDKYGGSFENRIRFALEVVEAIHKASSQITIEYKLPIVTKRLDGTFQGKGGLVLEEAIELAKILEQHGVHALHIAQANHTGNMNDTIPAMGTREYAFMRKECKAIKSVVSIPVSTVGRIIDVDMAEDLLQEEICDYVGFGRPLLADPDMVNKTIASKKHLIRKCIMCNKGCTDAIQNRRFLSCVLNAENGYEYKRSITPAREIHKVAIVGAGIAGLEAARVATLKGHKVIVFEKSNQLFGQINIAAVPPRKDEMLRICEYYKEVIQDLNIEIRYNEEFTKELAEGFEDILVAVGAQNAHPPIPGIEYTIDAWDVLAGKEVPNKNIVIAGGGLVGVETSEYLAQKGYQITILEMADKIAREESNTIMPTILEEFKKYNVQILTNYKINEFKKDRVICENLNQNIIVEVPFANCINALASKKNKLDLSGVKADISYIGDCLEGANCNIENATKTAYDAANKIGM